MVYKIVILPSWNTLFDSNSFKALVELNLIFDFNKGDKSEYNRREKNYFDEDTKKFRLYIRICKKAKFLQNCYFFFGDNCLQDNQDNFAYNSNKACSHYKSFEYMELRVFNFSQLS